MSITPLSSQFRGARRWRIFFSGPLASGAFATSPYAVADTAIVGPSPITVEAAYAVSTDPNAVELSVSADFVDGLEYTLTCTAVPGTGGGGTFTGTFSDRTGLNVTTPSNVEPAVSDIDLVLYQRDLYWNGQDFVEDGTGDLQTVSGQPNYEAAMSRRMISSGIKWAPRYGAKAYQYVDAPQVYQKPLAGVLLGQARQDDRTASASVTLSEVPNVPGGFEFDMKIAGRDHLSGFTISVPVPT
jgi:hypothetical protein